jgi:hypothetical protein
MEFKFIKQKLVEYPCMRKFIKNIFLILSNFKLFQKRIISPITEAVINKSSLFRTCTLDNSLYGIDQIYKDIAYSKEVYFEHGYYLGESIPYGEKAKIIKTIYTISEFRVPLLKNKLKKNIKYIEPYIKNSDICEITKNNILNLKKSTGKQIRLFIPGHSEKRNKIKISQPIDNNKFTTIVLVYYLDYEYVDKNNDNIYVSCGHNNDLNYLRRLKSLFLYSDYIETDFFGTHVIYADALKLPINFVGNIEEMKLKLLKLYKKLNPNCSDKEINRVKKEISIIEKFFC